MSFARPRAITPLPTSMEVALDHVMNVAVRAEHDPTTSLVDAVMILCACVTELAEKVDRLETEAKSIDRGVVNALSLIQAETTNLNGRIVRLEDLGPITSLATRIDQLETDRDHVIEDNIRNLDSRVTRLEGL